MARRYSVSSIRSTRRAAVHNVDGIRNLAIQFKGLKETKLALAQLPAAVQRKVLRQATAAAARPVLKLTKAYAKQTAAESKRKEGIGTTARSMAVKVAMSKKNPAVAYALIGADRRYAEFATLQKDFGRSGARLIQAQRRIRQKNGKFKVRRRDLKSVGPLARKARLDPKSNASRQRRPSRYLHLIEMGSRRNRAAKFMRWAAHNAAAASKSAFADVMEAGIKREFDRMAAK